MCHCSFSVEHAFDRHCLRPAIGSTFPNSIHQAHVAARQQTRVLLGETRQPLRPAACSSTIRSASLPEFFTWMPRRLVNRRSACLGSAGQGLGGGRLGPPVIALEYASASGKAGCARPVTAPVRAGRVRKAPARCEFSSRPAPRSPIRHLHSGLPASGPHPAPRPASFAVSRSALRERPEAGVGLTPAVPGSVTRPAVSRLPIRIPARHRDTNLLEPADFGPTWVDREGK